MSGIGRDNLPRDQPVEEHAQGGQVLLHRRRGEALLGGLDERGDVDRPDEREVADAGAGAPFSKPLRRVYIGAARMVVVDLSGEEFDDARKGGRRGGEQRSGRCEGLRRKNQLVGQATLRFKLSMIKDVIIDKHYVNALDSDGLVPQVRSVQLGTYPGSWYSNSCTSPIEVKCCPRKIASAWGP